MDGISFRGITVPEAELDWVFDTSGGPGGQHANRNATRVTVSFDLDASASVPPDVKDRLRVKLVGRVRDGVIVVTVDDTRSQWRNRAIARDRLASMLSDALTPRRSRRPTRPTRASRRRRLETKRHRGEIKRLRGRPKGDE
jgi:ribosome-associated protein